MVRGDDISGLFMVGDAATWPNVRNSITMSTVHLEYA